MNSIFCIVVWKKEVSFWGYWPVEGFGAVGKTWRPWFQAKGSTAQGQRKADFAFSQRRIWKMHSKTEQQRSVLCEFLRKVNQLKNLLVFILAKPLAKMDTPKPLGAGRSTGLLGNLQQDFCGIALRNDSHTSLTNIICHHSFLPFIHITFNQIEETRVKKSWYETILFFPFDKHLWKYVFFCFLGFFLFFSCFWRVRCSSKEYCGGKRGPLVWTVRWKSKFSNETNGKKFSKPWMYSQGPISVHSLCSNYKKMLSQCSILIQVKPGFWLLNLLTRCQKLGKMYGNGLLLYEWPQRTLMFMPSKESRLGLPPSERPSLFLVKSILLDLFSLEGHHELGIPNVLLIKNSFTF